MEQKDIHRLVALVSGTAFASLGARTRVGPGLYKTVTDEKVFLFRTKGSSAYEGMVRRRLSSLGISDSAFVLSDLPWGHRIDDGPLIEHKDRLYLQTVLQSAGVVTWDYFGRPISFDEAQGFLKHSRSNQGLPEGKEVLVRTYDVTNITKMSLMGATVEV